MIPVLTCDRAGLIESNNEMEPKFPGQERFKVCIQMGIRRQITHGTEFFRARRELQLICLCFWLGFFTKVPEFMQEESGPGFIRF